MAGALDSVAEEAQVVAEETGVAYEPPTTDTTSQYDSVKTEKSLADIDFTPQESYIDKATSTVSGQLDTLLSSNSPYIQQAREQAAETAQSRGLLNSTMAARSGQEAAIAQALPIAQYDAQTYAQSDLATQAATQGLESAKGEAIIQGGLNEQSYYFQGMENYLQRMHDAGILDTKNTFEATENSLTREYNKALQDDNQEHAVNLENLSQEHTVALETLENQQQTMITNLGLAADKETLLVQGMSTVMDNYLDSVNNLMTDPSFLELSGLDLQNTINNLQNMATNQMSFLGSLTQTGNIDDYINAAFPKVTGIG